MRACARRRPDECIARARRHLTSGGRATNSRWIQPRSTRAVVTRVSSACIPSPNPSLSPCATCRLSCARAAGADVRRRRPTCPSARNPSSIATERARKRRRRAARAAGHAALPRRPHAAGRARRRLPGPRRHRGEASGSRERRASGRVAAGPSCPMWGAAAHKRRWSAAAIGRRGVAACIPMARGEARLAVLVVFLKSQSFVDACISVSVPSG